MKARRKFVNNSGDRRWYRMDNSASIFPVLEGKTQSHVWRVTVTLKKYILPEILLAALNNTIIRFPYYAVKLKTGLFWQYFEKNTKSLKIYPDPKSPCVGINYRKNNGYLFEVKYFGKRIALEGFHSLSDGAGGIVFLNNILAEYLRLSGHEIEVSEKHKIFDLKQVAPKDEIEDSYKKYYNPKAKSRKFDSRAYPLSRGFPRLKQQNLIIGKLSTGKISLVAKENNATIGEFLAAVFVNSIYLMQTNRGERGLIRVAVPVNLRNFFPSNSMRNFSYVVNIELNPDLGEYTFLEILKETQLQMKLFLDAKKLRASFSANVASETHPIIRFIPMFIKAPIMSAVYFSIAEKTCTAAYSNIGKISLPPQMAQHVDFYSVNFTSSDKNPKSVAVAGFEDVLAITFCSMVADNELERLFFSQLVEREIPVEIETNID